jgi:hypothetical protein
MEKRGLSPAKWGSCGWSFLHYVALGYPARLPSVQDRRQYRAFFVDALPCVLPCLMCRNNLRRHITHAPPDQALSEGRDALFAWTVRLHNIVNRELGKQTVDVRAARLLYDAGLKCSCRGQGWLEADAVTVILLLALGLVAAAVVLRL